MLKLFSRPAPPLTIPGLPGVAVTLRRSDRARRLSLRVGRLDGAVTLTVPARLPQREAQAFLTEKAGWIARALARRPEVVTVAEGALLPVEGCDLLLTPVPGRGPARIDGDRLILPGTPAQSAVRARAYLMTLARDRLALACDRHAAQLGRRYAVLALRDTRSRWGSCTTDGRLMFSWRLAMAPPPVLDYVAAHEVAHLVEMNHAPAFWAVVERLWPGHDAPRRWLKTEGQKLHLYRFEA